MIMSEKVLRSIIREMINEFASGSGSGGRGGPVTTSVKKGGGGYEYEFSSNGKIRILKTKGGVPLSPPKVITDPKAAIAIAREQLTLGAGGSVINNIANGTLVYDPSSDVSAAPKAPTEPDVKPSAGPKKGIVMIARQDFFPVEGIAGPEASAIATKMFGQGHGFAVVIDPSTGTGHRFDFGRYGEAASCKDDRWLTKAGVAIARKFGFGKSEDKSPEEWFGDLGIHTMGVLKYHVGKVKAVVSPDGKITNLKQFCAGLKKSTDGSGGTDIVAVPVNDASAALSFAKSKLRVCIPYALPGAQGLTYKDTENCGTMAQKILMAGSPNMIISVETKTLVDTPDALYENLASSGTYQTCSF